MATTQSPKALVCGALLLCAALIGATHWEATTQSLRTASASTAPTLRVTQAGLQATSGAHPLLRQTVIAAASKMEYQTLPSVVDGQQFFGFSGVAIAAIGALASLAGLALFLHRRNPTPDHFALLSTAVIDKGSDPEDEGSDARTERHRIAQRIVYNMGLWRKHRAAARYSRAFLSIPESYVINHVANPVLALSLVAAGICALETYLGSSVLSLPTSLFSLSAPSLGLLLVFRTNASYERWDGARKMIGLVKNRSEDLTRQICTRFPENRQDLKEQFLRYLQAYFFALKVHLRSGPGGFEDDSNIIQDLTPILKPQELELCLKSPNRPAHTMHCMTQVAKAAGLDGAALFCLDQNLTVLADVLGGCERIRGTPVPLSYTRMTTRFLFMWLLLLPLAMASEVLKLTGNIWLTVPAEAFIAFALLGVEEVAIQIEEPFTILPLEAYAENSRKNTTGIFNLMADVAQVGKSIK